MKLKHVAIKNFRSIHDANIEAAEDLNVLIGRNNSGKSNLLSCIQIAFGGLRQGNVIIDQAKLGEELAFFNHSADHPIEISVFLQLTLAERDELIGSIISEFPQMKNAVEGMRTDFLIMVTLRYIKSSRLKNASTLLYVYKIAFADPASINEASSERIIIEITTDAAVELQRNFADLRSAQERSIGVDKFLSRFDRDDYRTFKSRDYFPRIEVVAKEAGLALEARLLSQILAEADTYDDLRDKITAAVPNYAEVANEIQNRALASRFSTITGEVTAVPAYALALIKQVGALKVLLLKENRKQIGAEEAQKLLDLKISRGGPDKLRRIQDTVLTLLGVQLDAFAGKAQVRRAGQAAATAELDVDNFLVEANGAGIREALRIVLDFEFGHPDILLIEEPEIHLHPALERSMLRYLQAVAKSCQVFLTTHSTNFLDSASVKNVYLISKNGSTKCRLLTRDDIEEHIPRELGIRLSSLFLYDKLVFVEGKTDEDILHEFASILGKNLSNANVGFIAMGGARNFAHFATEATLAFLRKRQVQCYFIVDRDERSDEDVQKMLNRVGSGAHLKVLNRREIENYLLIPRAISKYLREQIQKNTPQGKALEIDLSEESIQQNIDAATEELLEISVMKRTIYENCRPIYCTIKSDDITSEQFIKNLSNDFDERIALLSEMKGKLAANYHRLREGIEADWSSRRSFIVPGEELLKKVFSKYGFRYRKERDGIGIASSAEAKDIDSEISNIIDSIALDREISGEI